MSVSAFASLGGCSVTVVGISEATEDTFVADDGISEAAEDNGISEDFVESSPTTFIALEVLLKLVMDLVVGKEVGVVDFSIGTSVLFPVVVEGGGVEDTGYFLPW